MRSGACTVQQTLTVEAASVLKHSLSLARRRGHAQVTPLHVAATLLSSRTSLLRRACLKSQPHQTSHPLQCRALELCFNVALNRLPTTPGPLLHAQPSLSNALIAALKRAQAHQRRGCIEQQQQQQQPLLTIKVELEQLIISILDDPSVSRVMREAGFSSTAIKNNIEDSSASSVFQCYSTSGGVFSSPGSPSPTDTQSTFWQTHFLTYSSQQNPFFFSPEKKVSSNYITDSASLKEDIKLVFEVFLRKKRKNTVIVGDHVSTTEGLVSELKAKLERGDVPDEIKHMHFVKFYFAPVSLRFMRKEDVEKHLTDLKRRVDSFASVGEGAIIYTGDLRWTAEDKIPGYSAADHLVTEIGKLLSDYNFSNTKVWLVATASYQTYLRCQMRQPPLEAQWALQAVSIPSGGLGLSLHASSCVRDSRMTFSEDPSQGLELKPFAKTEEHDKLTCCAECTSNYEKDVHSFKSAHLKLLPSWMQPLGTNNASFKDEMLEFRRKWNRLCHSLHQSRHNQNHLGSTKYTSQSLIGKGYPYASSFPLWPCQSSIFPDSTSISFIDSGSMLKHIPNAVPKFRGQNSCTIEFSFCNGADKHQSGEPNLHSLKNSEDKEENITLALGNSLFPNSGKPAKETSELCKLLEDNVPWQSEIIPTIVEALMDSKSTKNVTWLLIQGNDVIGKRRLAHAVAESVLGSADFLLHMNMRNYNEVTSYCEGLKRAFRNNERLVILVENVDLADTQFLKLLADGFETGTFGESTEGDGAINQAIFILTKSISSSYEDEKKNQDSVIEMKLNVNEKVSRFGTPNSDNKRKAKWDVSEKIQRPRIDEEEDASSIAAENGSIKKDLSRQSSFNTLDLNTKVDESGEKTEDFSPISSDLTRETTSDPHIQIGFHELIQNRYIFNQNTAQEKEMKEFLMSKMKSSLEEYFGGDNEIGFSVEERVLEGILLGSSHFLNSLFEKWLKDIFQTGLQTIKIGNGGKEGIDEIRLSYGGIREKAMENGFMGTCLPNKIQVSFMG
ncbi:hypothetical protein PTKIN_Ptkin11bG0117800 [Pterospermum kingtungense]